MLHIPSDYASFFHWVKQRTESWWNAAPASTDAAPRPWIRGARWVPLTAERVDTVEDHYGVRFTPEHRLFLQILHTIDRKEPFLDEPLYEGDVAQVRELPFFHHWLEDEAAVRSKLDWPRRTILDDVLRPNGVWLRSWGERPASVAAQEQIFSDWYERAPRLLPLRAHSFLVSDQALSDRPVLSVYGSDIIVTGWDLRLCLINALSEHLQLHQLVYDETAQRDYPELVPEVQAVLNASYAGATDKDIPYWKEMILYYSTGWSSFGMICPFGPRPPATRP